MPAIIYMTLMISNKEPLKLLAHAPYRYSQAKLNGNKLRYFRAGVSLVNSDTDYEHIQLLFSTKRAAEKEDSYVRKYAQKTCVPLIAKVEEIEFNGAKYNEFPRRIGIELMTMSSCEIDIESGKVIFSGEIDSELSMSTFNIGYPLGQTELVKG